MSEKKEKTPKGELKEKKEVIDGEVIRVRRGLPRTNQPVKLPDNITWLKQSNIITLMAADFKLLQLRALIVIVEKLQESIEESIQYQKTHGKSIPCGQLSLFQENESTNNIPITIAYKDLGVNPDQYDVVKTVIKKLISTPVELDTINPVTGEPQWSLMGLVSKAHFNKKYSRSFVVEIDRDVMKVFHDVDKGFTRYIKEIAFGVRSKYSVRIYMLISSWKEKGGFSIYVDRFRKFLKLENKYKEFKELYRWIIRPAYEELFEKANCWFEMAEIYKEPNDSEPYKLNFKVIKSALSVREQEMLETQRKQITNLCSSHFRMTDKHLNELIPYITLDNVGRVLEKLSYLFEYIDKNWNKIHSMPDYILGVLKKEIAAIPGIEGEEFIETGGEMS